MRLPKARKPNSNCSHWLTLNCSWDSAYETELTNYLDDEKDEGVVWFSESQAEEKVINYMENLPLHGLYASNTENAELLILDLGTGNGHQLLALKDEGWKAKMVGVDYSEASVKLARKILKSRQSPSEDIGGDRLRFERWDILKESAPTWFPPAFDVVLDKGTFDAISLDAAEFEGGRRGCEVYPGRVYPLIKDGGYLIITSCNWTAEELKKWFDIPELAPVDTIKYPRITFGGVTGQTVSGVCFQRRNGVKIP